jgi:hypothetical protein
VTITTVGVDIDYAGRVLACHEPAAGGVIMAGAIYPYVKRDPNFPLPSHLARQAEPVHTGFYNPVLRKMSWCFTDEPGQLLN